MIHRLPVYVCDPKMKNAWFPIAWWLEDGYLVVKAETEEGGWITLHLDPSWSQYLDMRNWYRGDGVSSIMRCSGKGPAARIMYITSSFDWLGRPTNIKVYDGEVVHDLDMEGLIVMWRRFKPHLVVVDRHDDWLVIARHSILLWALRRQDWHIPSKANMVKHHHRLGLDREGKVHMEAGPLELVPDGCAYMPIDQWMWLDQDHRSILLRMVDKIGPLPVDDLDAPLTWKLPSWHRQKGDRIFFDMNMYAGQGEACKLMASYTSPSGSILFMRPPEKLYPYMHQIDVARSDTPIMSRCTHLANKYRRWIGDRHELFYCHILNGTHHKVSMVQSMPRSKGDVSVMGIIQRKRFHRLLDLMLGSKIKSGCYHAKVCSLRIASFCEAFRHKPTIENMMSLLHQEYLICGAKYKDGTLIVPLDNIIAHVT